MHVLLYTTPGATDDNKKNNIMWTLSITMAWCSASQWAVREVHNNILLSVTL